ncbi:GNAT family N-acetyltransferase [Pseudomonas cremoricolorata]|uniref:GNAT family acetyltransferase n=1 Tax=Pseudomonas cremoricolorata TaxID=157783 RepID=A0A089YGD4_9PSED|nr:GNAT family N-acetyltransferase [Pseudomonas cremoricolorata]AIR90773.1 GNAT family acetyltransferase [Pseudomonas cremoricolorata]
MSVSIRPAQRSDAAQILAFIIELAEYERARHEVIASVADIERSLFDEGSNVCSLICERDGVAIGYAVYFYSYSTWLGRRGIYLEDLYITPEQRGAGAGRELLRHIAQEAVANDCGRLEWSVLDWNAPAIGFYQSLGAEPQDEWIKYRLEGERLLGFAEGRKPQASR